MPIQLNINCRMTELVYLTLSHFNYETRNYLFSQAGYPSLIDYELSTENVLYEIAWNHYQECFAVEESSLNDVDSSLFFAKSVSFANLSLAVKEYLFARFLQNKGYDNFEEYFLNHHASMPSILVYLPYKSVQPVLVELKAETPTVNVSSRNGVRHVSVIEKKELADFVFKLNSQTKNSYVLIPPADDFEKNPNRYTRTGWNLFGEKSSPIFYRTAFEGFLVSKKYYSNLLEKGAQKN
jgi:hypothetical protein